MLDHTHYPHQPWGACGASILQSVRLSFNGDEVPSLGLYRADALPLAAGTPVHTGRTCLACVLYPLPPIGGEVAMRTSAPVTFRCGDRYTVRVADELLNFSAPVSAVGHGVVFASGLAAIEVAAPVGGYLPLRPLHPLRPCVPPQVVAHHFVI